MNRVVLVGNGYHRCPAGEFVDACDMVVRFNGFEACGYEQYVGTKTTVWCVVQHRWRIPSTGVPYHAVWIVQPQRCPPCQDYYDKLVGSRPCTRIDYRFCDRVAGLLSSVVQPYPTTGCVAVQHVIEQIDQVYVLGFNHFQKDDDHPSFHYYGDAQHIRITHHRADLERKYFMRLEQDGRIIRVESLFE